MLRTWKNVTSSNNIRIDDTTCLSGRTINISSLKFYHSTIYNSEENIVGGYIGEIWKTVAEVLNFSLNVNQNVDTNVKFGTHLTKRDWIKVLEDLKQGETQIVPYLMMSNNIRNSVDFTQPYFVSGFELIIKNKLSTQYSWMWPLSPFSPPLWYTVLMFMIFITFIVHLSQRTARHLLPQHIGARPDFCGNLLNIYGLFCYQGFSTRNFITSIRIMLLCTSLLGYIVVQTYAATLISHIAAVTSSEPPFNNFHGLLKSKYSLAIVEKSSIHRKFKTSKGNEYEAVWKNAAYLTRTSHQAVRDLCSGHVATLVSPEILTDINIPCKANTVGKLHFSYWMSSGLIEHFPCKAVIDTTMLRLRENGISSLLKIRYPLYFSKQLKRKSDEAIDTKESVQLLQIAPILSLYAVGIVLATVLLLVERAVATRC